jgi:Uma2 family endonuclease
MLTAIATERRSSRKKMHADRPGRSVVIPNVDWETYEKLLDAFDSRRKFHLIYDRGDLEIMAPISSEHESDSDFLGDMIKILADEMNLMLRVGGSFTMKRRDLARGLEPDRSFWIKRVSKLKNVRKIDLSIHPPPDLVVEVDITSSSHDKFEIYAKLGVPEIWRLASEELHFHRLGRRGRYLEIATSLSFPGITPRDLMEYLLQVRKTTDLIPILRAFRSSIRKRLASERQAEK